MATPFQEISKLMFMEMKESSMSQMDMDIALDLLSDLIITSATVDFVYCEKDLNKFIPYKDKVETIFIDEDTNNIKINKLEEGFDRFFIRVNNVEIDEFDHEFTDNDEIIITYDFKQFDKVDVVSFFEGEFEEDLTHREKYIIALGAYNHYINQQVNAEENLKTYIGDKDYSRTSNWQTLNSLISLKRELDAKLEKYIYKYSNDNLTVEDLL